MRTSTSRGLWNQNSSSEGRTTMPPLPLPGGVLRGDLVGQLVYDVLQLCSDQKQQLQTWETTGGRKKKERKSPSVSYIRTLNTEQKASENRDGLLLALFG